MYFCVSDLMLESACRSFT